MFKVKNVNNIDTAIILNRIRQKEQLGDESQYGADTRLAKFLGISPQRLGQWITRNTLDLNIILTKCANYDLNWLFFGERVTSKISEDERLDVIETQARLLELALKIATKKETFDSPKDYIEVLRHATQLLNILK